MYKPHHRYPTPSSLSTNSPPSQRIFAPKFSCFCPFSPEEPHNLFPGGAYRKLSKSIRTYQRRTDTFRLIPIGSDKFRSSPTNIPRTPNPTFPSPQRTLVPVAAHLHPIFCTLTSSLLRTNAPTTNARTAPHLRKSVLFSSEETERLYDESGAVLPYNQTVAPMLSERLYGGIWEKSIGYPRKVYRVFPESL